jgi:lipopolysaccharide/colanic/teichoic acid biosynthesis glycosyltransferase
MVALDCAYAERWSPLRDLQIAAVTVWHMMRMRGM